MLLVQHGTGPALEFHQRFGHVTKAWAKRHGLGYRFSDRRLVPHRSPHWEKPLLLEELLYEQDEDLFWVDGDAVPVKKEESPIPAFKPWADLAMCADQAVTPFNTGVMFIRNNSKMKLFLKDVNEKGPLGSVRHHDQARICERLAYHDIFLQTLELRWNFAGCTDWAKLGCNDPVIRAFHGWPKHIAMAALDSIVEPPTVKKAHTLYDEFHVALSKTLKLTTEGATLFVLSRVQKQVRLGHLCDDFNFGSIAFEFRSNGEEATLWTRNSYGLQLVKRFKVSEFAKAEEEPR